MQRTWARYRNVALHGPYGQHAGTLPYWRGITKFSIRTGGAAYASHKAGGSSGSGIADAVALAHSSDIGIITDTTDTAT